MDKLKIRRYKSSDKAIVWKLHKLGLAEIGVKVKHGSDWDKDIENIEKEYLGGDFIVGEYGGEVVCIGGFRRLADDIAELRRMRVHPNYQRKGFGQVILKELEKRARRMRYRKVILSADENNQKAINFYKKNKYKKFKREILYLRNTTFRMILFKKDLI